MNTKPGFYWTTTGIAGQTGYTIELSATSTFTSPMRAGTPLNITGVSNNYIEKFPNYIYEDFEKDGNTKTTYWRVRAYNTLEDCSGDNASRFEFKYRYGIQIVFL